MKPILDACCGSRMFWFDKNNPMALFMDNRELDDTLCDGRSLQVKPDVVGDFRDMPGSPPRMRGLPAVYLYRMVAPGITPAHAGLTDG